MKKSNNLFLFTGVILFLTSCSPKLTSTIHKTYPPLQYPAEVKVFEIYESVPLNAEKLGTVKVGDSGFSINCNYAAVLDMTKNEARRVGGNAVKITEHKYPDLISSCHRITADVLRISMNAPDVEMPEFLDSARVVTHLVVKAKFPHFRIAVDVGGQYRLAPLASGLDAFWTAHLKKMKSGLHYDAQFAYFFTANQGLEIMFSQQFFSNTMRNVFWFDEEGNVIASGALKETNRLDYAGVNYIIRFFNSKKTNCFLMNFGIGYLGYLDKMIFNENELMKITAETVGVNFGLGYDIGISKNFAIGFKLAFRGGSFRNYQLTQDGRTTHEIMPDKTAEGLGTVKLSVGLRFNK
jgi:hypothetical protein